MTRILPLEVEVGEFSPEFTTINLRDSNYLSPFRFTSPMNLIFIRILDIPIELYGITRSEIVRIACKSVDVLQIVNSAYGP